MQPVVSGTTPNVASAECAYESGSGAINDALRIPDILVATNPGETFYIQNDYL